MNEEMLLDIKERKHLFGWYLVVKGELITHLADNFPKVGTYNKTQED